MSYYRTHNVTYHFTAIDNTGNTIANLTTDIAVRIDRSASHHNHQGLTDVYVNQLLNLASNFIGHMRKTYSQGVNSGGWHGGTYRVSIGDKREMHFSWNSNGPYLYHIDMPQVEYHAEKKNAFKSWQQKVFDKPVGKDPYV